MHPAFNDFVVVADLPGSEVAKLISLHNTKSKLRQTSKNDRHQLITHSNSSANSRYKIVINQPTSSRRKWPWSIFHCTAITRKSLTRYLICSITGNRGIYKEERQFGNRSVLLISRFDHRINHGEKIDCVLVLV